MYKLLYCVVWVTIFSVKIINKNFHLQTLRRCFNGLFYIEHWNGPKKLSEGSNIVKRYQKSMRGIKDMPNGPKERKIKTQILAFYDYSFIFLCWNTFYISFYKINIQRKWKLLSFFLLWLKILHFSSTFLQVIS